MSRKLRLPKTSKLRLRKLSLVLVFWTAIIIVELKRQGFGKFDHHRPISKEDLDKIRSSYNPSSPDPKSLQQVVWFNLMFKNGFTQVVKTSIIVLLWTPVTQMIILNQGMLSLASFKPFSYSWSLITFVTVQCLMNFCWPVVHTFQLKVSTSNRKQLGYNSQAIY